MSPSCLVLVSGGVDSALSVHLLKEKGYRVEALFLKMTRLPEEKKALESARALLDKMGIRLHVKDVSGQFERQIVGYFERSYLEGKTPNCCCICNLEVKFFHGLKAADQLGLRYVATGHYARVLRSKLALLLCGADQSKDQSYFLHRLTPRILERTLFPLGLYTKKEVREKAASLGLLPMVQDESQDVCFFKGDYREFLRKRHPEFLKPGKIVTVKGEVIGTHKGACTYTVGQRRGLGIPDSTPYYVVEIRAGENIVVVGKEKDIMKRQMEVSDINWIVEPKRLSSLSCKVKIRSRHRPAPAVLSLLDAGGKRVRVDFIKAQKAVTPGQFAVFYKGKAVLGGGRICG